MRHAVVMAGGGGTRLWPASRRARPKQLLPLGRGGESLLAATVRRLGAVCPLERTWVVTAATQAAGVAAALPALAPSRILAEPSGRNTAAALGLAAVHVAAADPDAVLGCLPADQHVGDEAAFGATLERAYAIAERDDVIVTIGLTPTAPETGFGYLELGETVAGGLARRVTRFVEKPDRATAERYLASGNYLWNGGMFFLRAARLRAEIARHLPALAAGLDEIARALPDADAAAAATARVYPALPSISIDHGVMEQASGIVTVPGDFGWNDVGAWSALAALRPADDAGNVTDGAVLALDAHGNLVSTDPDTLVALLGVSDLIVVRAGDAVLVAPRARAQDVKAVVDALTTRNLGRYL